jgi:hypothetical protein
LVYLPHVTDAVARVSELEVVRELTPERSRSS